MFEYELKLMNKISLVLDYAQVNTKFNSDFINSLYVYFSENSYLTDKQEESLDNIIKGFNLFTNNIFLFEKHFISKEEFCQNIINFNISVKRLYDRSKDNSNLYNNFFKLAIEETNDKLIFNSHFGNKIILTKNELKFNNYILSAIDILYNKLEIKIFKHKIKTNLSALLINDKFILMEM